MSTIVEKLLLKTYVNLEAIKNLINYLQQKKKKLNMKVESYVTRIRPLNSYIPLM